METLCVSLMVGVALNLIVLDSLDNDVVKVDISEGETQVIPFDRLALIPGQKEEYVIDVAEDIVGDFDLVLKFKETGDSPLKKYVYAKVEADGKELCNELLSDLLDSGKTYELNCINYGKDTYQIKVTYYMMLDVGNPAQAAEASFDLTLTAKNG